MRKRCEKATEGPWSAEKRDSYYCDAWYCIEAADGTYVICVDSPTKGIPECSDENKEFITHARTDLPAVLDALDEAERECGRLRELLREAAELIGPPSDHRPTDDDGWHGVAVKLQKELGLEE